MKLNWTRRFSLRFLLLLITVAAVLIAYVVNHRRQQIAAVHTLELAGARVLYDWQIHADPKYITNDSSQIKAPVWMRQILGNEFFQSVEHVCNLPPRKVTSEIVDSLRSLNGLKRIELLSEPGWTQRSDYDAKLAEYSLLRQKLQSELGVEVRGPSAHYWPFLKAFTLGSEDLEQVTAGAGL
jgi:hypothetical protein